MKTNSGYRSMLMEELSRRQGRNRSYSLRAFARDIGIAPEKLCQILKGKSGLSATKASLIAEELGFDGDLKEYFVALVESEHGRSRAAKQNAELRLQALSLDKGFNEISLDSFGVISDWIHFAILELLEVDGFEPSIAAISKRLGITESVVDQAVDRLKKTGLLEIDTEGKWFQTEQDLATPTNVPSKAIREYHFQILDRAEKSLEADHVDMRDFGALTLAFNKDQLDQAKLMIREFRREFNRKFGKRASKDSVYCLATQLFPLDQNLKSESL